MPRLQVLPVIGDNSRAPDQPRRQHLEIVHLEAEKCTESREEKKESSTRVRGPGAITAVYSIIIKITVVVNNVFKELQEFLSMFIHSANQT